MSPDDTSAAVLEQLLAESRAALLTQAETTTARRANMPGIRYYALAVVVGNDAGSDIARGIGMTFDQRGDRDNAALALAFSPQVIRLQLASRKPAGGAFVTTWTRDDTYAALAALVDLHETVCGVQ